MPRISNRSNVHRGRFSNANASGMTTLSIVKPAVGTRYRVFNTGRRPFNAIWGGSGNTAVLRPKSSLDLVAGTDTIRVRRDDAGQFSGSYDQIDGNDRPRNGRFLIRSAGTQAISRMAGQYRVFIAKGTGDVVLYNGSTPRTIAALTAGRSVDVKVAANEVLRVRSTSTVQGSYVRMRSLSDDDLSRTGKFSDQQTIVDGIPGKPIYRIVNTGASSFELNYGGTDLVPVDLRCSVDARPVANFLSVGTGAQGIYERVGLIDEERGGTCVFTATTKSLDRTIVANAHANRFYRVINAGSQSIDVIGVDTLGVETLMVTVRQGNSFDLLPPESHALKIRGADSDEVKVLYEALSRFFDVRSGRIELNGISGVDDRHTLIDASAGVGDAVAYRILNACDISFRVWNADPTDPSVAIQLDPNQSFDLLVTPGNSNTNINIGRALDSGKPIAGTIRGIYDFIG